MPDGVEALIRLAEAPRSSLTRTAYNVAAFNPTAEEIRDVVRREFPSASITFDVDDQAAGHRGLVARCCGRAPPGGTGGFCPPMTFTAGSREYLIPSIRRHYQ